MSAQVDVLAVIDDYSAQHGDPDDFVQARAAVAALIAERDALRAKSDQRRTRFDRDFYPAWIHEHPDLFAKNVREFLDLHPGDEWECHIRYFAYRIRLTAIALTTGESA